MIPGQMFSILYDILQPTFMIAICVVHVSNQTITYNTPSQRPCRVLSTVTAYFPTNIFPKRRKRTSVDNDSYCDMTVSIA